MPTISDPNVVRAIAREHRDNLTTKAAHEKDEERYNEIMQEIEQCQ